MPHGWKIGAANARTFDPGAIIGRVLGRMIRMKGDYQPSIVRGVANVAKSFSDVANRRPCNIQRTMLRACCEHVPSMLRMRLRATSNIGRLSSPSPTCCDHIATCVACNIQHQEPSLPSLTQHLTLHVCKVNIRNIC
jgi:hypothetical protein